MLDLNGVVRDMMSSPTGLVAGLVDYAIKGSIILAVALIIIALLRKQSASSRHLILGSAFLGILLLPLFSLILPAWHVSILPRFDVQARETAKAFDSKHISRFGWEERDRVKREDDGQKPDIEKQVTAKSSAPINSGVVKPLKTQPVSNLEMSEDRGLADSVGLVFNNITNNWPWLVVAVWLGIGIPILIWLISGMVQIALIIRKSQIPDDKRWKEALEQAAREIGISHKIRVKLSDQVKYPLAWGVLRPTIVLPIEAGEWTAESIRIVLLHELSHVKRGDILIQCLAHLTIPLFWFNPLVWLASNRLQKEQEQACDDLVLESGIKPSDYALELLEIAGMIKVSVNWAGATMANKSDVKGRIMSILNPGINRKSVSRLIVTVAGLATLLTLLPVASAHIWSKPQAITLPEEPYNSESGLIGQFPQVQNDKAENGSPVELQAGSIETKVFQDDAKLDLDKLIGQLGSSDPEERAYAAFLISMMGPKGAKAVPALVKMLGDDTEIEVQFKWDRSGSRSYYYGDTTPGRQAGSALGSIGSAAYDAVIPVLTSENAHARENAVRALRDIGDRRALERIRPMVTDENPDVRTIVIRTMREMQDEGNIEYLAKAVSDVEPEVRILAIRALREFGNAKAAQAVFPALKDQNVEARTLAVRTLRENMSPAAMNAMKTRLTDEVTEIRELALRALREYSDSSTVSAIIPLLKDPESSIRDLALRTLREKGDRSSVKAIMEVMSDPDREMRDLALRALREFGGSEAVPAVITALHDDDSGIRELAVRTLWESGDKSALQALSQMHSDPNPQIRELALRALREHNDATFLDVYISYLNDEEDSIRELAVRALMELGDNRAVDPLKKVFNEDPNQNIRRLAARALSELDL